jgi:hypothetical protein
MHVAGRMKTGRGRAVEDEHARPILEEGRCVTSTAVMALELARHERRAGLMRALNLKV